MQIEYKANDTVTPEEMQSPEKSVSFGPHRSLERNRTAVAGSLFIATARSNGGLIGLIRLVGDGAYILHHAGIAVHPEGSWAETHGDSNHFRQRDQSWHGRESW